MGIAVQWMGIKTASVEELHAELGLLESGLKGECFSFDYSGINRDNKWYIIVINLNKSPMIEEPVLIDICRHLDLIFCTIEDHVMYTSCSYWSASSRVWEVVHNSQLDIEHLEIKGSPPDGLTAIRDKKFARHREQGPEVGVDFIYEIPVELARMITGYRTGEPDSDDTEPIYNELRLVEGGLLASHLSRRRSWLARLLSRR